MKRDTWIPGSNDLRFETPFWVVRLDAAIGRLMCRLGIHTDSGMSSCWYCGKAHGPRK